MQAPSQLSPCGGARVDLPGRYGSIAALRATAGSPELAATVLLLPGFTGSKEDFAPLLDPIATAGLGAIAIDLPGQYESPGPDDESAYLPDALGQPIAELIEWLTSAGERILLLGHSYGGLVARGAVLAGAPVLGLTLLDSGPGELPPGHRRAALDHGEPVLRANGIAAAQQMREQLDSAAPGWADSSAELREFLHTRFLRSSVIGLLGMADGLRHEPDRVTKLAHALRAGPAPCLVVCGEADDAWSVASQRDMADRLDADFAVIPGARHSPNVENPTGLLATLLPTWRAWLQT
ncbi:MAG TPA: alpha/beta fold hydrolase [Pseudonocardiaceae bacterium]|nr:alpha/beta fold hydrolase [Pseudonocardiaceae bacterium]